MDTETDELDQLEIQQLEQRYDDGLKKKKEKEERIKNMTQNKIMYNKLCHLKRKLSSYMNQLPVIGYNSSTYDINLIKSKLFSFFHFGEGRKDAGYVIKRNNAYLSISNEKFKFIDILQFLTPTCSYSKFLQAYNVKESKGVFPYDYFDDIEKTKYD